MADDDVPNDQPIEEQSSHRLKPAWRPADGAEPDDDRAKRRLAELENDPLRFTANTQTDLVLDNVREAVAWPPEWEDAPNGVAHYQRRGTILVRDWHRDRLAELLREAGVTEFRTTDVGSSVTRVQFDEPGDGRQVQDAVAVINKALGGRAAGADHLVYVCSSGHSCAAIEPEEVPRNAAPVPQKALEEKGVNPADGHGVRVLVLDTGLVPEALDPATSQAWQVAHPWMANVTGEPDLVDPNDLGQDAGHGTFTAGCVAAVAPEASIHVVNATSRLPVEKTGVIGAVFESDLAMLIREQIAAAQSATNAAGESEPTLPDVLVLNFAGLSSDGGPLVAFDSLYDDVLQHLKETLILSPAGNEGDSRRNWPGSFAWVVSVGALDEAGTGRAGFSNFGRHVDVYAPGDKLVNAYATGTYRVSWAPSNGQVRRFDGMARWSGTSFSTPLVAGMVAARMSATGQSSRRAWLSLLDDAEAQAIPGVGAVLYPA